MKNLLNAVLLTAILATAAHAQTTPVDTFRLSLQQSIEYAIQHQPTVQNARLDQESSRRYVQEITGLAYPQINATVDVVDFFELPTSLIPGEFFGGEPGTFIPVQFGTPWNSTAAIQATQLLVDGRYFLGLKATHALADLSRLEVGRTEIEAVESVMKAYLAAVITQERSRQLESNIARFKKLHDDTKAQYDAGFVEKLDVDRISVNYNNLLTEKSKIDNLSALSYYVLKFQMGMDVNNHVVLTDSIREDNFEAVLQNAATPDLNNRIEYQQLLTGRSLAEMNIKQYQLGYVPTLYAFGSYSYQAQREEFNFLNDDHWYPTGSVGLTLSIPIFDGLQKARKVQQGRLHLQKNENNILNFQNSMNLQVSSSKANLTNAIATLETQSSNVELAQEVVDISRKKFELGVGTSLEVTDAESSLRDAQTNYLTALYDAWVSKLEMQKALGTLYKPSY